ncbi:hypothetical protein QR680_003801 [Steinernema hermaphroditum]|nr:hypothetical protein QR680_003801 [Steinernema hermaphroditum]
MSGIPLLRHSRSILAALPPRPSAFKPNDVPATREALRDAPTSVDSINQIVTPNGHLSQYSYMVEKMDIAQPTLEGTYRSNSVSPYKMVMTLLYS